MVFNRNTSAYFPAASKGGLITCSRLWIPYCCQKIGIPSLFVLTAGIHLLICSLVIFLNEERNNERREANFVFTEDSWTILECFMQTSKHGQYEQPKHNQGEAQAFFQGMSRAWSVSIIMKFLHHTRDKGP